jgi:hypothetical protein
MDHHEELRNLIANSPLFTRMLRAVRVLDPPDWVIGAGAVRSLVWNHLHGYGEHATFRDVDVAFFDPEDLSPRREIALENMLRQLMPEVRWEVKNQAAVHLWYERKFGLAVGRLVSIEDAVATWPETCTCVGVRLQHDDHIATVAPFGLEDLFQLVLRRNPRRVSHEQFLKRARVKEIRERWPRVQILDA